VKSLVFSRFVGSLVLPLAICGSPCLAGDDVQVRPTLRTDDAGGLDPRFDILNLRYEWQDTLGFDDSDTELDASRYTLGSFLSTPISLGGDWKVVPYADYSLTTLDFDQLAPGSIFGDEDLHKASVHGILYHQSTGSPWLYGAWARVTFASDGDDVGSDDFYYDLAIGAGYVFSDTLVFGLGIAGLELGSDDSYLPGPMLYWKPTDTVDVSIVGALFDATWEASDDWVLAVRGAPFGNSWNVDDNGVSKQYDLSTYSLRFHVERRLVRDFWLSLGIGYTFADEFEVRDSSGDRLFKDDLEGGLAASVGFRLRSW
jgi:hypothetical protein